MKLILKTSLILSLVLSAISCSDSKEGSWAYRIDMESYLENEEESDSLIEYIKGKDQYFCKEHIYSGIKSAVQRQATEEFFSKAESLGDLIGLGLMGEDDTFLMGLYQIDFPGDTSTTHLVAYTFWAKLEED